MGDHRRNRIVTIGLALALVGVSAATVVPGQADAVHFYRGPGSGCSPADGALSDDGSAQETPDATVKLSHNTFHDGESNAPVTVVEAGDTVRWEWNSEHCHSVTAQDESFDSGFHYPEQQPDTPEVAPGLFGYPVPELEDPTLTYSHTFEEPGRYPYFCVHHGVIGMQGVVIVQEG